MYSIRYVYTSNDAYKRKWNTKLCTFLTFYYRIADDSYILYAKHNLTGEKKNLSINLMVA